MAKCKRLITNLNRPNKAYVLMFVVATLVAIKKSQLAEKRLMRSFLVTSTGLTPFILIKLRFENQKAAKSKKLAL